MSKEISEIVELLKSNKLIEAEKKCLKLTENIKNNLELLNIYAVILFRLKKYDQAIDQWKKTTILDPKYFFGFNNLGNVYLIKDELDIALKNYNIAIELKSNYYEAIYNKANIYLRLNNFTEAIEYFDKVLKIKNDYFQAHQGKAIAYKKLFKFKESIEEWQKVYQYNPGNTHALVQKGNLLFDTNRLDVALKAYTDAFQIEPEKPFLLGNIIHTKSKMCLWNNFEKDLSNFKKDILENKKVSSPYVTLTLFDDPKIHLAAAKVWSNEYLKKNNQEDNNDIIKNQKKDKIRIGYYSADFRTHAMGHLLVRMFELHNKEKFEIYGFYFGPTIEKDDELSKRIISSFDKYIDVSNKNDGEIVELTKSIGIDIAVDLMCFTGNFNRFGIFTKKCAPLQINFLGYPGTSGSNFIDYIIIDKKLISDENKNYFSEKLIFLPDSYQPNEEEKKFLIKNFLELNLIYRSQNLYLRASIVIKK